MNRIAEYSWVEELDFIHPVFNIHDDLTFILPDSELEWMIPWVAEKMAVVPGYGINIPFTVEISVGPNWGDKEMVGEFSSDKDFHDSRLEWYHDREKKKEAGSRRRSPRRRRR
jgi:hypothetical protein